MIDLNHHGWSIDFCGDSYCLEKDKNKHKYYSTNGFYSLKYKNK